MEMMTIYLPAVVLFLSLMATPITVKAASVVTIPPSQVNGSSTVALERNITRNEAHNTAVTKTKAETNTIGATSSDTAVKNAIRKRGRTNTRVARTIRFERENATNDLNLTRTASKDISSTHTNVKATANSDVTSVIDGPHTLSVHSDTTSGEVAPHSAILTSTTRNDSLPGHLLPVSEVQ